MPRLATDREPAPPFLAHACMPTFGGIPRDSATLPGRKLPLHGGRWFCHLLVRWDRSRPRKVESLGQMVNSILTPVVPQRPRRFSYRQWVVGQVVLATHLLQVQLPLCKGFLNHYRRPALPRQAEDAKPCSISV
jgi:hypothetical protein